MRERDEGFVQRDKSLLLRKDIGDLNTIYIPSSEQMVRDVTRSDWLNVYTELFRRHLGLPYPAILTCICFPFVITS